MNQRLIGHQSIGKAWILTCSGKEFMACCKPVAVKVVTRIFWFFSNSLTIGLINSTSPTEDA